MTFPEFHNGLRVLLNIDHYELVDAGIMNQSDHNAWGEFRRDPFRWFIRAPDATAEKLWNIIERRMRKA